MNCVIPKLIKGMMYIICLVQKVVESHVFCKGSKQSPVAQLIKLRHKASYVIICTGQEMSAFTVDTEGAKYVNLTNN